MHLFKPLTKQKQDTYGHDGQLASRSLPPILPTCYDMIVELNNRKALLHQDLSFSTCDPAQYTWNST